MYINIAASKLLTLTHCTHTKIFLKEAGIISSGANVTFDKYVEELSFNPEDTLTELGINEDWESRNQVIIN